VTPDEAEATRLNYLSPVYKIDEAEHRKLIDEAAQVGSAGGGSANAFIASARKL